MKCSFPTTSTYQYKPCSNEVIADVTETVNKVLDLQRQEYEELDMPFNQEKWKEKFLEREHAIQKLPKDWDAFEPSGGLKLTADPNSVDSYVQEKFANLQTSGILIRKSEFEKQYDTSAYRKPGVNGRESTNLTRIWGAEYLRKQLVDHKSYSRLSFV